MIKLNIYHINIPVQFMFQTTHRSKLLFSELQILRKREKTMEKHRREKDVRIDTEREEKKRIIVRRGSDRDRDGM